MLAVTASIVGGDLVIAYNAAGDSLADISSDGTIYTVSGTGLPLTEFNVAFEGATTLTGPVALSGGNGDIRFQDTVNGGFLLSVETGGLTEFNGFVGGIDPLAGLGTDAPGETQINGGGVTTVGGQTFNDAVTLEADTTLDAGSGPITFASTLDDGSEIRGFSGTGVAFGGDSAGSRLAGFTIAENGGDGIRFEAGDYTGTVITANTISDNGNPTTHEGNGILVEGSNLMIGWTATAGEPNTVANTITGNAANGIEIRGAAAQKNAIVSNSIYANGYSVVVPAAQGVGILGVTGEDPTSPIVGSGIALTDGGNGALPSPRILGAVADTESGMVRVQVVVPADGSYYVQLFANTAADELGLVPVDVNGFEGRSYVGDSPAHDRSQWRSAQRRHLGKLRHQHPGGDARRYERRRRRHAIPGRGLRLDDRSGRRRRRRRLERRALAAGVDRRHGAAAGRRLEQGPGRRSRVVVSAAAGPPGRLTAASCPAASRPAAGGGERSLRGEEFPRQQRGLRPPERRHGIVVAAGGAGLVAAGPGVAKDDHGLARQVDDPVVGDAGGGVEGRLRGRVKLEARVGHLDEQRDLLGQRPPVGVAAEGHPGDVGLARWPSRGWPAGFGCGPAWNPDQ